MATLSLKEVAKGSLLVVVLLVFQINSSSASEGHRCGEVMDQRCQELCEDSKCVNFYGWGAVKSPVCQCEKPVKKDSNYLCAQADISSACSMKCGEVLDSSYQPQVCTSSSSESSDAASPCVCVKTEDATQIREKRADSSDLAQRKVQAKKLNKALTDLITACSTAINSGIFKDTDDALGVLDSTVEPYMKKLDVNPKTGCKRKPGDDESTDDDENSSSDSDDSDDSDNGKGDSDDSDNSDGTDEDSDDK